MEKITQCLFPSHNFNYASSVSSDVTFYNKKVASSHTLKLHLQNIQNPEISQSERCVYEHDTRGCSRGKQLLWLPERTIESISRSPKQQKHCKHRCEISDSKIRKSSERWKLVQKKYINELVMDLHVFQWSFQFEELYLWIGYYNSHNICQ